MNIEQLRAVGEDAELFPFYTAAALAERWGVVPQYVTKRRNWHEDFPQPVEGIIKGGGPYYPLHEILRYEQTRGIKVNE